MIDQSLAAKDANRHILELAEFEARVDRGLAMAFYCECGCLKVIEKTAAQYRADGGAFLRGHASRETTPEPASGLRRRQAGAHRGPSQ